MLLYILNHTHEILHAFAFHITYMNDPYLYHVTYFHRGIQFFVWISGVTNCNDAYRRKFPAIHVLYHNIDTSSLHIPTTKPPTNYIIECAFCFRLEYAYRWHRYASELWYMTNVSVSVIEVNVYKHKEVFLCGNYIALYSCILLPNVLRILPFISYHSKTIHACP